MSNKIRYGRRHTCSTRTSHFVTPFFFKEFFLARRTRTTEYYQMVIFIQLFQPYRRSASVIASSRRCCNDSVWSLFTSSHVRGIWLSRAHSRQLFFKQIGFKQRNMRSSSALVSTNAPNGQNGQVTNCPDSPVLDPSSCWPSQLQY
jgi:hypothetical protein